MKPLLLAGLLLAVLSAGCNQTLAFGSPNSVIVVAPNDLWKAIKDSVDTALEQRILTTRPERTFNVTQISPANQKWGLLRQFQQVIVVGRANDGWVKPVLAKTDTTIAPPMLVTVRDVWARQQLVTALVLPPSNFVAGALSQIPALQKYLDHRFHVFAVDRMFISGVNAKLRDSLNAHAGFSLTLPKVYKVDSTGDSVFMAYNNMEEPKELMRFFTVDRRVGIDTLTTEQILQWREALIKKYFSQPQVTQRKPLTVRTVDVDGQVMQAVQGVWSAPRGAWPGAGPFFDRVIRCPANNRTYFIDAWLYAPSLDKYQYFIQLQTIVNSFRCAKS